MFHNLLLAVDGVEPDQIGTSVAIALARQHTAAVHVVHVNQYLLGGRGLTAETPEEAADVVRTAVAELQAAGIRATGSVRRATCFGVAAAIVDTAHHRPADAIVLGSHRRRGLRRLRSQGIRERVTRLTAVPVLTAPAPLVVTHLPVRPHRVPSHSGPAAMSR